MRRVDRVPQAHADLVIGFLWCQTGMDAWWNPHRHQATLDFDLAYRWSGRQASGEIEIIQNLSFDSIPQIRVAQLRDPRTFEVLAPGQQYSSTPIDADHVLSRRAFGQVVGGPHPAPEGVLQFARAVGDTVDQLATALRESVVSRSSTRGADLYVREVGDLTISTGRFGEGTIRVLSALQAEVTRREGGELMRVWCKRFGLDHLTAGWVGRNELQLQFTDPSTGTALPIGAAGSGSHHLLPFIVNCFASARPRLLLADELEQGLHPQFQIQLAHLLAEVIARGNQVISCTQSPTLVLAIFSSVARARLKAEQVAIYSMKRDETGGTIAVRNQISDSGEIVDGWFEPYARAERQLLEEFLPRAEEPDAPAAS